MNTKLLNEIKEHILKNPQHFLMEDFFCGTSACIAGWAVCLAKNITPENAIEAFGRVATDARELLDITNYDIFFVSNWPAKFYEAYIKALTPEARAQIAADVIDDYIKNDEWM